MNLKRSLIVSLIMLSAVLGFGSTFAQTQNPPASTQDQSLPENAFFGVNLGLMWLPVGFDAGYNFKDFGVRVSLDTEYSALEGYARFRFSDDSSYWYAGGGVGYSILGGSNLFGSRTGFVDLPFGISGVIGVQFASGFFAEYQPFLLLGALKNDFGALTALLAGAVHIKVGWRFFF
jgi:opacity protein-like surface antigen